MGLEITLDTFEITSESYQRNRFFGSPPGGWKILRLTVRARGIGHKSGDVFVEMHKFFTVFGCLKAVLSGVFVDIL